MNVEGGNFDEKKQDPHGSGREASRESNESKELPSSSGKGRRFGTWTSEHFVKLESNLLL